MVYVNLEFPNFFFIINKRFNLKVNVIVIWLKFNIYIVFLLHRVLDYIFQ